MQMWGRTPKRLLARSQIYFRIADYGSSLEDAREVTDRRPRRGDAWVQRGIAALARACAAQGVIPMGPGVAGDRIPAASKELVVEAQRCKDRARALEADLEGLDVAMAAAKRCLTVATASPNESSKGAVD